MAKPVILTSVAYYLPGYKAGGTLRTISNMVEELGDLVDFRIVTSDRDLGDTKPYANIRGDAWNTVGKARVFYASPAKLSLRSWIRIIRETPHDVIYLNSFFNTVFTMYPLIARRMGLVPKCPAVLAPRGEFSTGALELSRQYKVPYILFSRLVGLYGDLTWQASSEFEANDIRKVYPATFGKTISNVIVAPDLPNVAAGIKDNGSLSAKTPAGRIRVCSLSRIAPMKNLDYALRVLSEVKVPVEFDIYGVMESKSYWEECQAIIARMPKHVSVAYHGGVNHENVIQTLSEYDLFFLPTRGENYGHVIHEALLAGLPVLISDQTPWRNLASLGVGWDIPLSAPEEFCAVIELHASRKNSERAAQGQVAQQYARNILMDGKALRANLSLFV